MHDLVAGGAPRTAPQDALAAMAWFEARAGFPEAQCFAKREVLRRTVEWATAELTKEGTAPRPAVQLPVAALVSMELLVMDSGRSEVLRVLSWVRLLKTWGVMRWDDA